MIETMEDAPGTGLGRAAGPCLQARVVVFFVSPDRAAEREGGQSRRACRLTVLINPADRASGRSPWSCGWEACLSVPELAGEVPRHWAIRYQWRSVSMGEEFVA